MSVSLSTADPVTDLYRRAQGLFDANWGQFKPRETLLDGFACAFRRFRVRRDVMVRFFFFPGGLGEPWLRHFFCDAGECDSWEFLLQLLLSHGPA